MKKAFIIILALMLISTNFAFAGTSENISQSHYNDLALVQAAESGGFVKNDKIEIREVRAEDIITDCYNISTEDMKVYLIKEKISSENINRFNLTGSSDDYEIRAVVKASVIDGKNEAQGQSNRVFATAVLGYSTISNSNGDWVTGKYYGGKIDSQPNSSQITTLSGYYKEYGASYIDITGKIGQNANFTDTKKFDISKHTTLQKKTVNTGKYVDYFGPASVVGTKLTIKGTANGYSFSFVVPLTVVNNGAW